MRLLRPASTWLHEVLSRRSSLFWTAIVSGMLVLLIVVAVLQYRWTTQVTEATEARIGSNLRSLMTDWHLDLYRGLSAICVALQVGPDSGARDDWTDYMARYLDWRRTAKDPELVANAFIWETSEAPNPPLLHLNPSTQQLEKFEAPGELKPLLDRLQARSSTLSVALRAWKFGSQPQLSGAHGPAASDPMAGWQFDATIPALVHPIIHHEPPVDIRPPASRTAVDWIVLVLRPDTIQNRILPDITRQHFEAAEEPGYAVTVTAMGSAPRVLFSSRPASAQQDLAPADATMTLFGPPEENTDARSGNSEKQRERGAGTAWQSFAAPVWFPVIQYTPQEPPWVLAVYHRRGSLEATVATVRRRNLATSAAILLLLAISMGLVVVAGHRAQKLARLQMDFVTSVSHELRTPLAVICSAAENIADGVVDTPEHLTEYGSLIHKQTRQLIQLADEVLLLASSSEGKNRYVLRPLQVSEIIQTVLQNMTEVLQSSGFTVEQDVQADLPEVLGDLPALCQCLQNLVVNAVKYGGQNRWIGIRAFLHAPASGTREIRISIQDRGIGISRSELPHVFEPFYRSPAASAQIRGTGLGLPLAKGIAEAMRGRLSVVSEIAVGSVFTLHLPLAEQHDLTAATTASAQGSAP